MDRRKACIVTRGTPASAHARVIAYSWDFHALDERAQRAPVGLPDHAMLIIDVARSRGDAVPGRTQQSSGVWNARSIRRSGLPSCQRQL
jgi:hypothetical protein